MYVISLSGESYYIIRQQVYYIIRRCYYIIRQLLNYQAFLLHFQAVITLTGDYYIIGGNTLFAFLGWKRKPGPELSRLPHQLCGIRFLPVLNQKVI